MIFALLVAGAYALATLRRYSLAQTATLTTFALFLSSGITTMSAAPTDHNRHKHHSNDMKELIWKYPCYTQETAHHQKLRVVRHVAHRGLDTMKKQFILAQNKMKLYYPKVEKIYHNVTGELKDLYNLPWLPEKQLAWYNKNVLCLDKSEKLDLILPRLDDTLQIYAITFYSLKHVKLNSNSDHNEVAERNVFVNKMYDVIRGMLCELVTVMQKHNMTRSVIHDVDKVRSDMHWTQDVDFTEMVTQDSGIIQKFRRYIKEWKAAMKNAAKPKDSVCDRSKTPPVSLNSGKKKKKNKNINNNNRKRKIGGKVRVKVRKQVDAAGIAGQTTSSATGKKKIQKLGRKRVNNSLRKFTGNKHLREITQ